MDKNKTIIDDKNKMSEKLNKNTELNFGEYLKKTRESLHLTIKEAAGRLYLTTKIIELIEANKLSEGPPMTFMRGYLRSYAKLLGIPEDEIKDALSELELSTTPLIVESPTNNNALKNKNSFKGEQRYINFGTYIIIAILATLVALWWRSHGKEYHNTTIEASANLNKPEIFKEAPQPLQATFTNNKSSFIETTPTTSAPKTKNTQIDTLPRKNQSTAKLNHTADNNKTKLIKNNTTQTLQKADDAPNLNAIESMIISEP